MSQSRAFANQEREAQVQRLSRFGRGALLLVATVMSFATVGLLVADQLYRPEAFVINELKIKGKFRYLDPQEVETAVVEQQVGNFFSVDLLGIQKRIERLPWVQHAQVRREWPNTLFIHVSEHQPVMRWGESQWVNSAGQVIDLPDMPAFGDQVVTLSGNEEDAELMMHSAFRWQQQLGNHGLALRKLALSGSHAWVLELHHELSDAHFELLLGRTDIEQRLERFRVLFDKQFANVNQALQRVDARYPDGLAIKAKPIIKPVLDPDNLDRDNALAVNQ